jgi:hypothetical protein
MPKNNHTEYTKEAKLSTTAGRYFIAKQKAKTKKEAAIAIGYNPTNVAHLEDTKTYKEIEKKYFATELLKKITLEEIAERNANIIRSGKDADSINATKLALERIEPETSPVDEERVLVILRKPAKLEPPI